MGYHLARLLTSRGESVRLLVRPSSSRSNIKCLDPRLVETVEGDLRDQQSLQSALVGCDLLYHVAADYRLWSKHPDELYQSNVEGTRNILDAARNSDIQRTVYTSTVGVIGIPDDGSPGDEHTPVAENEMIGNYKHSKFQAEQVAVDYAKKGMDIVIVNPSTPVGENDVKPTPTGKIIVDFLNGKLPAFVDTGLNLVDVHDVAEGMRLAAVNGVSGERYILGNKNISLKEMLTILSGISGQNPPAIRIPYRVAWLAVGMENIIYDRMLGKEPPHSFEAVKMAKHKMYFSSDRARKELKLPCSSIETALERAVIWFRDNGYAKG